MIDAVKTLTIMFIIHLFQCFYLRGNRSEKYRVGTISTVHTEHSHTRETVRYLCPSFYLPVGPSSHPAVNHCLIMCPEITEHRCPVHVQLKLSGLKLTLLISQQ